MRNPKFKSIKPNYRRRVFEVVLEEGKKLSKYSLPFAVFRDAKIGEANRTTAIKIDAELGRQGAELLLEDGSRCDFPADLVLYYCDPTYDWSPVNQLKRALKQKTVASRLSVRVLADALGTSPSQVVRLFEANKASKQLMQLFQVAELTGHRVEFILKRKAG